MAPQSPVRPEAWRRFFRREEFQRHRLSCLVPRQPTVDIMHGDLECRYTFPVPDGRTPCLLNLPWLPANRQTRPAPYKVLTTDLREGDVVLGGVKKAGRALRLAVRGAARGEVVLLNSGCVPDLTGEDLTPLAARCPKNVLYHRSDGRDMAPVMAREMLELSLGEPIPRGARGGVTLVAHPGGAAQKELVSLLEEAGVRVGACLVPDISPRSLALGRRAGVQLVLANALLEGVTREIVAGLGLPAASVPAPYGLRGTRAWLKAAAGAAGSRGWEKTWARRVERVAAPWRALTVRARACRLGFVLDPSEATRLSDPAWNAGVPMVEVLKELGFGIELLIHSPRGGRCSARGRHAARFFSTEEELARLLRASACRAFYSDCFFDSRLSRAGKAQFSLASFEAGPEGALRTLERLLAACRLPFYRKYSEYL